METETRMYEINYLLRGDLEEEKTKETVEALRKEIEEEKGIIIQEKNPGKQNLGYPIKKHETAYFGSFQVIFPAENFQLLEKNLSKFDFLRVMVNKLKRVKEGAARPARKRLFRQPQSIDKKGILSLEEARAKEPASPRSEPLQVEEIDKKLEEILGK